MPILVQCPACKASCSVAETNGGGPVRCPKCLKPFVVRPTGDGKRSETNGGPLPTNVNPFPTLPAEFGRYRILKLLGRGGMGAVYLAQDSQLGRQCALKVPFFDAAKSPQRAERFVREARSAAVLQHPNICTVYDAGQINGRPFITMAYLAGKPLEADIDPDAPMPQARAAAVARKIALALEHAHGKGIVHRDLKPANVMMTADGEPVVMDFGLAKRVADVDPNEAKLTRVGGLLGTPSYMSPEQVKGDVDAIGPATDVYSLGVMLFEMLTGRTPYSGPMSVVIGRILTAPPPPVREFRPDVDGRLNAACLKAMAKEPAERFQSMAEFAEALNKYLKAPSAPPPPLVAPPVAMILQAPPPAADRSPFDNLEAATPPTPPLRITKRRRVVAGRLRKWPILVGVAVCLLLAGLAALWAGGVFKVQTADGILVVQVNEPNAEVFVDGDRVTVTWSDGGKKAEIHVKPGTRKVEVRKDGFGVDGRELTFKDGDREVFTARLLPEPRVAKADQPSPESPTPPPDMTTPDAPPVTGAADEDKGFVSLFNGKDLTGWSVDSGAADRWKVGEGQIKGYGIGSAERGWLLSEKDYKNFVLTLEFQVAAEADGAVGIRARSGEMEGGLPHHLAIKLTGYTNPANPRTGAFYYWPNTWQQPSKDAEVAPSGEWNKLTVQVQGEELRVSVNGQEVQNLSLGEFARKANVFPGVKRSSGRIGLQQHTGEIRFRNIAIKELPPAPEPPVPAAPADPFQPKSVWVNEEKGMTLTVIERNGEMFRAHFEDTAAVERDVTGTVKDGKLIWLAKDVRATKGGPGGDNQATITRDKDGDLLDFTYSDKGRTLDAFVLRLKTSK